MVRLAIITDSPGRGGAYKVATDIAQSLDKSEYEVRWFFLCDQVKNSPPGIYLGTPPVLIDYSLKSYLRLAFFPKQSEKIYETLNSQLKAFNPDIIHFHTHAILLSLASGIKKTIRSAKLIFTDHSQRLRPGEQSYIKQLMMSKVYKKLFSLAQVVFVSKYAFQTALGLGYGIKEKDLFISNSVDTYKFTPLENTKETDSIKLVYLARIHHAKGHDVLLDAWKLLPVYHKVSLHLYGDETDGGAIRQRIEQDNFPNPVYYEGVTSSPEKVLQNAHIGVFPSYREGLPLALLEMMACELPVIASDIPEIESIISHNNNGLLFKCGNVMDLKSKMEILITNSNKRMKLGYESKKTVEKNYSDYQYLDYKNLYKANT